VKEKKRILENNIIRGVVGDMFQGVKIESDYFDRERRENAIEQGVYEEPMPELVSSDTEHIIRKSDKDMSEVENERAGGQMLQERIDRFWPERENLGVKFEESKITVKHD